MIVSYLLTMSKPLLSQGSDPPVSVYITLHPAGGRQVAVSHMVESQKGVNYQVIKVR